MKEPNTPQNSPSTFHSAIAGSPVLQARWDAVSASVIAHAKAEGAVLTKNDVERLPSAKLAVLDGSPLEGNEHYHRELANLPAVIQQRERAAKAEALARGDKAAQEQLQRMTPAERMTYARANGLDKPNATGQQTAEDVAAQMRLILSLNPVERLSAWRRMQKKLNEHSSR
jgi:hypothetical protein